MKKQGGWEDYINKNADSGVVIDLGSESPERFAKLGAQFERVSFEQKEGVGLEESFEQIKRTVKNRSVAAITLFGELEFSSSPKSLISLAHKLSMSYSAPVIVSVINAASTEVVLRLLEGNLSFSNEEKRREKPMQLYTEKRLEELFFEEGFCLCGSFDKEKDPSIDKGEKEEFLFTENTLVGGYIKELKDQLSESGDKTELVRAFVPTEEKGESSAGEKNAPFISVIMRTQGKRNVLLREALMSLYSQKNKDFDVFLMLHKVSDEDRISVTELVDGLPKSIRDRVRINTVDFGGRSTPLNEGIKLSDGKYIAVLDDDDIVKENWVDEFYKASKTHFGNVLHAYTVSQDWSLCEDGTTKAISPEREAYCEDYDYIKQLKTNRCPPMSYIMPRFAFTKIGLLYDDSLNVAEDWDALMQVAAYFGVFNIPIVTSVYRHWLEVENSEAVHNEREWSRCIACSKAKTNAKYLLLPASSSSKIDKALKTCEELERANIGLQNQIDEMRSSTSWRMTAWLRKLMDKIKR